MKGNNMMVINQATMCEAIQDYIDNLWEDSATPKVIQVKGSSDSFEVYLTNEETETGGNND